MNPLRRSFYTRPTLIVAPDLLGTYIVKHCHRKVIVGKIVEVEAYCQHDPASHAFRGQTQRNEVMFSRGGYLYVYFTYGMHFCANIVTEREGLGEAVLIRAIEPIEGTETMIKNRYAGKFSSASASVYNLSNGPAKFCQAFAIARKENGTDLLGNKIFIIKGTPPAPPDIGVSPRVGIRAGKNLPWRFFIKNNPWVSK